MKFLKRGVALALFAAFTLASQPAQAFEKDKTYKITFCIPTITMATSGAANTVNTVCRRKKHWWMGFVGRLLPKGAASCCCPVATSTPAFPNRIYRMLSLTFVG